MLDILWLVLLAVAVICLYGGALLTFLCMDYKPWWGWLNVPLFIIGGLTAICWVCLTLWAVSQALF